MTSFLKSNFHQFHWLVVLATFIVSFILPEFAYLQSDEDREMIHNPNIGLWETSGKVEVTFYHLLTFGVYEGDTEQTFYRPSDMAIDQSGNIYVLDSGNFRVQVFDSSGRFLNTIGKGGQGPGEFSNRTKTLMVDSEENVLYVFDAGNRRMTIIDTQGNYKDSWPVRFMDDLLFDLHGDLVASNFILQKDHKPIHRYSPDGSLRASFGYINEPGNNLIEMVNRSLYRDVDVLSNYGMTNLAIDHQGDIYYSQKNPYLIHKYDPEGKLLFMFTREVPFSTLHTLTFEESDKGVRKFMKGPYGTVGQLSILKNGLIAVPVFSPEKDSNFIDFYQSNGKFLFSTKLPMALDGPSTYIISSVFDDKNNFYCLYGSRETFPKVVKYAMTMQLP